MCYMVKRDSSAVDFDVAETAFILSCYPLTDKGGEETKVPITLEDILQEIFNYKRF